MKSFIYQRKRNVVSSRIKRLDEKTLLFTLAPSAIDANSQEKKLYIGVDICPAVFYNNY